MKALFVFLGLIAGCITFEIPMDSYDVPDDTNQADTETGDDTSTDDSADTYDSTTGDTYDTGGESTGAYTIMDADGVEYQVDSYLEFNINPNSPSGAIDEGSADIVTIDATALGGDIVLTQVYFYFSGSDYENSYWLSAINEVVSGVYYDLPDLGVFESFGAYSSRDVLYYDDPQRAIWSVVFSEPITILKDSTFTFTLEVTMGGADGLQPAATDFFYGVLWNQSSWHGTDDPGAYPITTITDETTGGLELTLDR